MQTKPVMCTLTKEQKVKVRRRGRAGQNPRAGVQKAQLNSSCWNNLNFLAEGDGGQSKEFTYTQGRRAPDLHDGSTYDFLTMVWKQYAFSRD